MRKVYYLSTCSTSKRVIEELELYNKGFEFQDIKIDFITETQLERMYKMAGSYEALFSKIARKYKELRLKDRHLTEADFKQYILEEYTFFKRPVIIIDNSIFIGSAKKTVEAAAEKLKAHN